MARTGQQLRVRTAKAMAERGGSTVKVATEKKSGFGDRLRYTSRRPQTMPVLEMLMGTQ